MESEPKPSKVIATTYGNLRNACIKRGYNIRMQVFDGGQTIILNIGHIAHSFTSEYGDKVDAANQAAAYMLKVGHLVEADFEG